MAGLKKIMQLYGAMDVVANGVKTTWVWDFAQNKSRIKSEMTHEEWMESEKSKFIEIKNNLSLQIKNTGVQKDRWEQIKNSK